MKRATPLILILTLMLSLSACEGDGIADIIDKSSLGDIVDDVTDIVEPGGITDILSGLTAEDSVSIDFHITPYEDGYFDEGRAWIQFRETKGAIQDKNDIIIDNAGAEDWAALIDTQGHVLWKKKGTLSVAEPFRDGLSYCLLNDGETVSYILLDSEGNETFTIEKDETYLMLGHGDGLFLVAKHILSFDTNEWQIGAIDQHGDIVVPFRVYEKLSPPAPNPVEMPSGEAPDPNYDYWGYLDYMEQLEAYEEYFSYSYTPEKLSFDADPYDYDYDSFSSCEYMGDNIYKLCWGYRFQVLLNIETQQIINTIDLDDERYGNSYLRYVTDKERGTYFKDGTATVLHTYFEYDEYGYVGEKNVVCTMAADGTMTPLFENRWTEDVLAAQGDSIILYDGLMYLSSSPVEALFPSGAYYNLEGECVLDFPEYRGKQQYSCDVFQNGYAAMTIVGVDGNIYITAIDKNGEMVFEPKQGFVASASVDGKYVIALGDGCIAVFDMGGNILHTVECVCIQPGSITVTISDDMLKVQDIFINLKDGTVIGKHMENDVTHRYNTYETMTVTSYQDGPSENTLPESTTVPNPSNVETQHTNGSNALFGIFTQVGLYDHEAYSYLDSEYVPTIYLYTDNSFEFHCNFYEYMHVYKGHWAVDEDDASAEFHFMVENDANLPNLDFHISHNKARCDADFYSDYDEIDAVFGMTSIDEVLFHVEY